MMKKTKDLSVVAENLHDWFGDFMRLCDASLFSMSSDPAHQEAAVLHTLIRNAKEVTDTPLGPRGDLYPPVAFSLAAACRRLGISPGKGNWKSAVENVLDFRRKLGDLEDSDIAFPIGTTASNFKNLFEEALINAGVTDRPTILDDDNQRSALGLAVNWGMRFLIAYALETKSKKKPRTDRPRDLAWIRDLVKDLA